MSRHLLGRFLAPVLILGTITLASGGAAHAQAVPEPAFGPPPTAIQTPTAIQAPAGTQPSIIRKLNSFSERIEMTVNTSRILTLDQKIPQAQVNNPEVLQITALGPNQIQISAKKAGVTQVNLWSDDKQIYTVDVIVQPDARELAEMLKAQFPSASLKVVPVASSVMISGYVDQPEEVNHVIRIAEEYYPKVINNITVSGVQQVLLHVRVMEVSRTKLRSLGFDFAKITGNNMVASSVAGLLSGTVEGSSGIVGGGIGSKGTLAAQVIEPGGSFFGVLEALREDKLLKVLAEPTLVTTSGRPAYFQVGGSVPTLVPQSLGTVTVEYKKYGTQLDFVPIVLGDGKVRLEVRPKISDIDTARSIQYSGYTIYAFKESEVETGVEMNAGQTLAIAGLVQNRTESQRRGLPWVSEVPYVGALFRRVEENNNEIELLILVTPELVDPLNPHEVPLCGPGMGTASPTDCELFMKGHIEVPRCCPNCDGNGCAECAAGGQTKVEGRDGPMPGMILRPEPAANRSNSLAPPSRPVPEVAAYPKSPNRYGPVKPQASPAGGQGGQPKPLPGFKGQTGYETVR